jgi:hypothetical protein
MDKTRYQIHKRCGTLERLRGDEISRLIAKTYPLSTQIALLMDKDMKPEEFKEYLKFREECKGAVDLELRRLSEEP